MKEEFYGSINPSALGDARSSQTPMTVTRGRTAKLTAAEGAQIFIEEPVHSEMLALCQLQDAAQELARWPQRLPEHPEVRCQRREGATQRVEARQGAPSVQL